MIVEEVRLSLLPVVHDGDSCGDLTLYDISNGAAHHRLELDFVAILACCLFFMRISEGRRSRNASHVSCLNTLFICHA